MKWFFELAGMLLLLAATGIMMQDFYNMCRHALLILDCQSCPAAIEPRWRTVARLTGMGIASLLIGLALHLAPAWFGMASIRPSSGVPGVTAPTIQRILFYDVSVHRAATH
jgi:hypothetical protein